MKIYGLSGKSGTGKSYNAAQLCSNLNIDAIIDDGLFICRQKMIAGVSAKKEETKLKAVRRAIFTEDAHARAVREAIEKEAPDSILVIGTSDEMIRIICEKLHLPDPVQIIQIEDITTAAERRVARKARMEGGIHVIPAPTMEVKNQFSGYFIDARRGFRQESRGGKTPDWVETIVRPTYSYLGKFSISAKVIRDIISYIASDIPGIAEVLFVSAGNGDEGMYIRVIVLFQYGAKVKTSSLELQRRANADISAMTAFNILGIEVEGRGFREQN